MLTNQVYSITSKDSLMEAKQFLSLMNDFSIPVIGVGNKNDLEHLRLKLNEKSLYIFPLPLYVTFTAGRFMSMRLSQFWDTVLSIFWRQVQLTARNPLTCCWHQLSR